MKAAPIPNDEVERLEELLKFQILDTEYEKDYDDLVKLAAYICNCPVSSITFIDANRQWFKASVNMPDRETSRDISFCSHAILQNDVFVVEDASKDVRFFDYPNVTGGLMIRFYAGAPIVSQRGKNLGTLCVIDTKARKLAESQAHALQTMASMVSRLLELRINNQNLVTSSNNVIKSAISYRELFDYAGIAQWIYDLNAEKFLAVNKAACELYDYTEEEFKQLKLKDIMNSDPSKGRNLKSPVATVMGHRKKDGCKVMVESSFSIVTEKGNRLLVGSITDLSEKLQLQKELIEERKDNSKQIENAALSAQLKERNFLGKELHDNISQMLSSTNIYLDIAYSDDEMRLDLIQKSQENLIATMNQLRSLSRGLVNTEEKEINLTNAIEELIGPYKLSRQFEIHYAAKGNINEFPVDIKTALLRVLQESLHNISKYAEAENVWIKFNCDKKCSLIIIDDGKGFDDKQASKGIGLKNMHDRIEKLKGTINIHSFIGSGTTIKIEIPQHN